MSQTCKKRFYKKIGNIIKRARYEYCGKMTQADLAKILKVSPNTISRWENGVYEIPLYMFTRIEKTLRVSFYLESFL